MNECLRRVRRDYDSVYICDLGIKKNTLSEFKRILQFAELIYIDHHQLDDDLLEALEGIDVRVIHDTRDCASLLAFDLLREFLPREAGLLASYAAISDRLENGPIANKIIQKYDRDFLLFEATVLSYALDKADIGSKRMIVSRLSNFEYPHKIDGVLKLALEQADRMVFLRSELPSRASKLGKIAYVDAKGDSPGAVASLLLDVCDATIGICYDTKPTKQVSDLSIRVKTGMEINIGKITSNLAERFGGFGGGHPLASGARIPTPKLTEFIRAINYYI